VFAVVPVLLNGSVKWLCKAVAVTLAAGLPPGPVDAEARPAAAPAGPAGGRSAPLRELVHRVHVCIVCIDISGMY
jgi:hypothetical protein